MTYLFFLLALLQNIGCNNYILNCSWQLKLCLLFEQSSVKKMCSSAFLKKISQINIHYLSFRTLEYWISDHTTPVAQSRKHNLQYCITYFSLLGTSSSANFHCAQASPLLSLMLPLATLFMAASIARPFGVRSFEFYFFAMLLSIHHHLGLDITRLHMLILLSKFYFNIIVS